MNNAVKSTLFLIVMMLQLSTSFTTLKALDPALAGLSCSLGDEFLGRVQGRVSIGRFFGTEHDNEPFTDKSSSVDQISLVDGLP